MQLLVVSHAYMILTAVLLMSGWARWPCFDKYLEQSCINDLIADHENLIFLERRYCLLPCLKLQTLNVLIRLHVNRPK